MPLYEISDSGLVAHDRADFVALGLYERADLQRLLREDISALGDDLLVVAEEFGQWEDARRRIDLLAIDRDAHLVVIELKRTTEGGHMELQALRYAAMVSSMRFEEVAAAYTAHAAKHRPGEEVDARAELLAWLDAPDGEDEVAISSDVRIILVSADFGREITTAVLWLNRFDGMESAASASSPTRSRGGSCSTSSRWFRYRKRLTTRCACGAKTSSRSGSPLTGGTSPATTSSSTARCSPMRTSAMQCAPWWSA